MSPCTALVRMRLDIITHVDSYFIVVDGTKETKPPPVSSTV